MLFSGENVIITVSKEMQGHSSLNASRNKPNRQDSMVTQLLLMTLATGKDLPFDPERSAILQIADFMAAWPPSLQMHPPY